MRAPKTVRTLVPRIAEALRLPRTAAAILSLLARTRRYLPVAEIVRRAHASERSVRQNLALLLRKGLLERRVFVTANRKLAYVYNLKPIEDLLDAARRDLGRTIRRLEALATRMRSSGG